MKRMILSFCVLVSFLCGGALASAPLGDHVPKDAIAYAGWAGRSDAFRNSVMDKMATQPEMKQIVEVIKAALLQQAGERGEKQQIIDDAFAMGGLAWRHRVAVALLAPVEGAKEPQAVLLIDMGGDKDAFNKHLESLLAAVNITLTDAAVGEFKYGTFQPDTDGPVISIGYMENILFVALGADMPAKLTALHGPIEAAQDSILNSPKFTEAYAQVAGKDEVFVAYADVPAIIKLVPKSDDAGQVNRVLVALGLNKVTALVSSSQIVDTGWYTKTRVLTPAPHQGVLMLMAGKPATMDDFAMLPSDTLMVASTNLDPAAVLAEVRRATGTIDAKTLMAVNAALAMADQMLGLSVQDDLLATMGDRWYFACAPSLGGFMTGTILMADLKDPQKFTAGIQKIEQMVNRMNGVTTMPATAASEPVAAADDEQEPRLPKMEIRTIHAGDEDIKYIAGIPVVSPAWAVQGDKLIIAAWPQVVEAALQGPQNGTLTDDVAFKTSFARLQSQPSSVVYVNTPAVLRQVYGLGLIGWATASAGLRGMGVDLRQEWLPSLPTVEKNVWPSISGISADEQGITFESYGSLPIGGCEILLGNPALLAGVMLPSLSHARGMARESMSQANLKSIGTGIALYQTDNKDKSPASLDDLVKAGIIGEQQLISPLSNTKAYIYLPQPADADPGLIVAYEDPDTHGQNKTAVLFAGFNVSMMPVDQAFWDLVEKSKESSQKVAAPAGKGF